MRDRRIRTEIMYIIVNMNLDVENMREAANILLGTHDFSAFKNTGSSVKTSVRTINRIDI